MWDKLAELYHLYDTTDELTIASANGVGKTLWIATLVLHSLECYPAVKVLTLSSNWSSLLHSLWPEIHRLRISNNLFPNHSTNQTGIFLTPVRFGFARATDTAEGIMGVHSPVMRQFVEEASGVEQIIMDAVHGNAKGADSKIVKIGNPINEQGPFSKDLDEEQVPGKKMHVHISAFDCPNVTSGQIIIPGAVSRPDIERDAKSWATPCEPNTSGAVHLPWLGEEGWYFPDARFEARVLGKKPTFNDEGLIQKRYVEAAMSRVSLEEPTGIGCDVARSEVGDETAIALVNAHGVCLPLLHGRGWSTIETAGKIKELKELYPTITSVAIDGTGIGVGVCDALEAAGVEIIRVMFANPPRRPDAFQNIKAEAYCEFADLVRTDPTFMLPSDDILKRQLTSLRRSFSPTLKIAIPDKATVKAKTGESPDRAEACIIGMYGMNFNRPSAPPSREEAGERTSSSRYGTVGQTNNKYRPRLL